MVLSQTEYRLIPRVILTFQIREHIPLHITTKELILVHKSSSLCCVLTLTAVDQTEIHTQTQRIGKTNPLAKILIKKRVGHVHLSASQRSLCSIKLSKHTLIHDLSIVVLWRRVACRLQSFRVRSLTGVIYQQLESQCTHHLTSKEVGGI